MRKNTVRKRPSRTMKQLRKRRFLPVFFFSLFLAGTCAFLYFFAILPRKTDAATPAAKNEIKNEIKTQAKDEAPTVRDLLTRDPTKVYTAANRVSTSGVGRIAENTAQGRLLAKRAALTDARRNLLELRQKLLGEPVFNFGSRTLSGHIIVPNIRSERIEGDLYHLDIDVKLEELLKADLDEEVFILPWQ